MTANLGREGINHPPLGQAGGSALYAVVETYIKKISDDNPGRFYTFTGVANGATVELLHQFGVNRKDIKVGIYSGTYPSLTRVQDAESNGWIVAEKAGAEKTTLTVTAPSSGGPFTFAVQLVTGDELFLLNGAASGDFLLYDATSGRFKNSSFRLESESGAVSSNLITQVGHKPTITLTTPVQEVYGIANPIADQFKVLVNDTGSDVVLRNDFGPTTASRILTGTKGDFILRDGASCALTYNPSLSRWVLVSSSGSLSVGDKNYFDTPNISTNMFSIDDGLVTVETETDRSLLPADGTQSTGVKVQRISGSSYVVLLRKKIDKSDINMKMKLRFEQAYAGNGGDYRIEVWANSQADYAGTWIKLPTAYEAVDGDFTGTCRDRTFDSLMRGHDYFEVRCYAVAGTTPIYFNNFFLGYSQLVKIPEIGDPVDISDYVPGAFEGLGTVTVNSAYMQQIASRVFFDLRVMVGTPTVDELRFNLPNGWTCDGAGGVVPGIGSWSLDNGAPDSVKGGIIASNPGAGYVSFSVGEYAESLSPFIPVNGNDYISATNEISVRFSVAITELKGGYIRPLQFKGQSPIKAGFMMPFAGDVIPRGWARGRGQTYKKETHAELYAEVGDKFATCRNMLTGLPYPAPASDEFRILDTRTLFFRDVGENLAGVVVNDGGFIANRTRKNGLTATAANSSLSGAVAASAGAHTHTVSGSTTITGSSHFHRSDTGTSPSRWGNESYSSPNVGASAGTGTYASAFTSNDGSHTHYLSVTAASNGAHTHTVTGTALAQVITIGNGDIETAPDAVGMNWIIKLYNDTFDLAGLNLASRTEAGLMPASTGWIDLTAATSVAGTIGANPNHSVMGNVSFDVLGGAVLDLDIRSTWDSVTTDGLSYTIDDLYPLRDKTVLNGHLDAATLFGGLAAAVAEYSAPDLLVSLQGDSSNYSGASVTGRVLLAEWPAWA